MRSNYISERFFFLVSVVEQFYLETIVIDRIIQSFFFFFVFQFIDNSLNMSVFTTHKVDELKKKGEEKRKSLSIFGI